MPIWRALACLIWTMSPVVLAARQPVEAFAALPQVDSPMLSPDGTRVASRMAQNGALYIVITSLFDAKAKPTVINLGEIHADNWHWVNDEWLLVWVGATSNVEGEKWYLSRLLSVSAATGKVNRLMWDSAAQNGADVIWMPKDGSSRILVGVQTSIYLNLPGFWPDVMQIDVANGRHQVALHGRDSVSSYYADPAGTIRMGYGYDDAHRRARLLYRDRSSDTFHTIDKADLSKRESLIVPSIFLADPGKALVVSNKDGFDAIYRYDIHQQTIGERVFGAENYDIDGMISSPAGDALAGVRMTDTRPRVHWIDPVLAKAQDEIDQAIGAGNARIVSWNKDQSRLIVHVGAPDTPGAYFFYQIATGRMQRFAWVNPELKAALGPVTTIHYKARDGLDISAILTLPNGRPAKALPLIVMPHGGPQARDDEEWDWQAQFLADRGYAVIQPNYRGSTGFGNAFYEKGDGQWGLGMQDDLADAITELAKEGIADPKRVCIMGGSYGGYAAMRGAQRDGAIYRCAISFAGVSDLRGLRSYDRSFLDANGRSDWLKRSAPDLDLVSPIKRPQDFSIPILLVHGKKDLRVPVAQSREMADKLKAAGKQVRYVEQPEADHHFSRTADRLQFLQEVETFLNQYNPA